MPHVVVFTQNNARVLYNPDDLGKWKADPRALVAPDLSAVRGIPPHFWKMEGGKVVPMTDEEQMRVLAHHDEHGVDNELGCPASRLPAACQPNWFLRIWFFLLRFFGFI